MMNGSDWPISNMESYIKFVEKLKLNKQTRDLLLFKILVMFFDYNF
jgi:hypothetical protein